MFKYGKLIHFTFYMLKLCKDFQVTYFFTIQFAKEMFLARYIQVVF